MANQRIFELRTYYAEPGKMQDLIQRFQNHTLGFFKKHGMTLEGFWLPSDPAESNQRLIYLLSYADRGAALASWSAFRQDPDWLAARTASEVNGPIVSRIESLFLDPVAFSPLS